MSVPDYDKIAPYYDLLSNLVFGQQLTKAEAHFLPHIKDPQNVLVFGGGTGKSLELLRQLFPDTRIYYLEASSRMISIASKRPIHGGKSIRFIHGNEQLLTDHSHRFDLIITSFVLDVFSNEQLENVINVLYQALAPEGYWIQTDFYVYRNSPWWQRVLVSTMYLFFRLTAKQRNQELADFDGHFKQKFLRMEAHKEFCYNMLKTVLYQKIQETDPSH